ncbi:hypothetical protein Pan181_28390 [Aeoliella mucimassa]|uniref:Uncharacterized protein n=1 Tax=Aeoliella mucimassa TaxID=2527972 RepID=A0A518APH3_9BACT|nr:hypothetical protein Pan181_28390 [Aeoliella mucimassa]
MWHSSLAPWQLSGSPLNQTSYGTIPLHAIAWSNRPQAIDSQISQAATLVDYMAGRNEKHRNDIPTYPQVGKQS